MADIKDFLRFYFGMPIWTWFGIVASLLTAEGIVAGVGHYVSLHDPKQGESYMWLIMHHPEVTYTIAGTFAVSIFLWSAFHRHSVMVIEHKNESALSFAEKKTASTEVKALQTHIDLLNGHNSDLRGTISDFRAARDEARSHPVAFEKSNIELRLVFDPSDQVCKPSIMAAGTFRVRVESNSPAISSDDVLVKCREIRSLHDDFIPGGSDFVDKTLKPKDNEGPRFSLHGVPGYVDFVRFAGSMNCLGKIHLCHLGENDSDASVDAGRYLITLRAEGRDCVSYEETFFLSLSGVTETIAPYSKDQDYSVVDEWLTTADGMLSMAAACNTIEHGNSWKEYCCRQLNLSMKSREHLDGFMDAVGEPITDDNLASSVQAGIDYLNAIKLLITDEQLR